MLSDIARLRRFNRAVTREVGALDHSYLGRGRPLGAARVLQLVTEAGTDVALIRDRLALDSGLMSRLLRSLEEEGLVITATDPVDRRRRIARLTPAGAAENAAYRDIGHAAAEATLARAGGQTAALLQAMDLIATQLLHDVTEIVEADPDTPEALGCLAAYYGLLVEAIPDLPADKLPLPLPDAAAYRPPQGVFLLALSDGMPVGCVSLRPLEGVEAEVKRLWVHPDARGQGLARRLMAALETRARAMGYQRLKLDSNSALTDAITLYRRMGWADCAPYTSFPADVWMTKPL
jgi:GNAT superfamily N-acetyltransferase/DNA-binding MarR family transcriptional regulator